MNCDRSVVFFFSGTPVSSTNKSDRHDIAEILSKVALNTITLTTTLYSETCLIRISLGPTFEFEIVFCLKKKRLPTYKNSVYAGFRFIEGSIETGFVVILRSLTCGVSWN